MIDTQQFDKICAQSETEYRTRKEESTATWQKGAPGLLETLAYVKQKYPEFRYTVDGDDIATNVPIRVGEKQYPANPLTAIPTTDDDFVHFSMASRQRAEGLVFYPSITASGSTSANDLTYVVSELSRLLVRCRDFCAESTANAAPSEAHRPGFGPHPL